MKTRKILSLILALTVVFCALPFGAVTVSAESYTTTLNGATLYYSVENGEVTILGASSSLSGDVTLPSVLDGYPVISVGYAAFGDCDLLTSITIPNSVTYIDWFAFSGCTSLTTVILGDQVTTIEEYAFQQCSSLKSLTIPSSVTNISSYAFDDCSSLLEINVNTNNSVYSSSNGILYNKDKTEILIYPAAKTATSYIIPDGVVSIGIYAFENCTSLQSVTIPQSVTSIGGSAFYGCASLTNISMGKCVENIGSYAFYDCISLTSITLPDNIAIIDSYTFKNCTSLTSIKIPDNVTEIGNGVFYNCILLNSITLGNNIRSIGSYAFSDCSSLTSITIPDSVTRIDGNAFSDCILLESITISDNITRLGGYAFSNTAYYNDPSNWENGVLYIGKNIIKAETTISGSYTIKNGTKTICPSAFYKCSNLTSLSIPDSLIRVGADAFNGCSSLKTVYYYGTSQQWNAISMDLNNNRLKNADIFFACSCGFFDFTDWKTTVEATCTKEGLSERVCNNCGKKETKIIPLISHEFTDWKTTVEATCTKEGLSESVCNNCGEKETEVIPMIPHNMVDGKCSMCGTDTKVIESEHNYANNTNKTWNVTSENAIQMIVTFSADTCTEYDYDFITIFDKNDNIIGEYSGNELASKIIVVDGDTVKIRLTSDYSYNEYGFKAEITPVYPGITIEGDLDGDGKVTSADVKTIKDIILGGGEVSEEEQAAYDVNGDGAFDMLDYIYIKKLYQQALDAKSDLNGDEKLDSGDVVLMKKAVLGTTELTDDEIEAYDLNGDNKLDILDLIRIKKLLANV